MARRIPRSTLQTMRLATGCPHYLESMSVLTPPKAQQENSHPERHPQQGASRRYYTRKRLYSAEGKFAGISNKVANSFHTLFGAFDVQHAARLLQEGCITDGRVVDFPNNTKQTSASSMEAEGVNRDGDPIITFSLAEIHHTEGGPGYIAPRPRQFLPKVQRRLDWELSKRIDWDALAADMPIRPRPAPVVVEVLAAPVVIVPVPVVIDWSERGARVAVVMFSARRKGGTQAAAACKSFKPEDEAAFRTGFLTKWEALQTEHKSAKPTSKTKKAKASAA